MSNCWSWFIDVNEVFHFSAFSYFSSSSCLVSLYLTLCFLSPIHLYHTWPAYFWTAWLDPPLSLHSLSTISLSWCCFFLIALCVPLLSPPFVPTLHWRGQMLAGMIAEPAFLSEYTIFALDHSNRPKTAQVASVVSLSSLPASSSCFSFSSSCPVPSSRLLRVWGIVRGLCLE